MPDARTTRPPLRTRVLGELEMMVIVDRQRTLDQKPAIAGIGERSKPGLSANSRRRRRDKGNRRSLNQRYEFHLNLRDALRHQGIQKNKAVVGREFTITLPLQRLQRNCLHSSLCQYSQTMGAESHARDAFQLCSMFKYQSRNKSSQSKHQSLGTVTY